MGQPATMADAVARAEARLKSQQELSPQLALFKSQDKTIAAFSALCRSLEGITAEGKSLVTKLRDELVRYRTKQIATRQLWMRAPAMALRRPQDVCKGLTEAFCLEKMTYAPCRANDVP